jgi:hypothetical protein
MKQIHDIQNNKPPIRGQFSKSCNQVMFFRLTAGSNQTSRPRE